jgi:hypothetical protein
VLGFRVAAFCVLLLVGVLMFALGLLINESSGSGKALWGVPIGWLLVGAGFTVLFSPIAAFWYVVASAGFVLLFAMPAGLAWLAELARRRRWRDRPAGKAGLTEAPACRGRRPSVPGACAPAERVRELSPREAAPPGQGIAR